MSLYERRKRQTDRGYEKVREKDGKMMKENCSEGKRAEDSEEMRETGETSKEKKTNWWEINEITGKMNEKRKTNSEKREGNKRNVPR